MGRKTRTVARLQVTQKGRRGPPTYAGLWPRQEQPQGEERAGGTEEGGTEEGGRPHRATDLDRSLGGVVVVSFRVAAAASIYEPKCDPKVEIKTALNKYTTSSDFNSRTLATDMCLNALQRHRF
jgi:hypothetical protein